MSFAGLSQGSRLIVRALLVGGLVLLTMGGCAGCSCTPTSPLIGQWRADDSPGSVIVYSDQAVSLFGVRCRWITAGARAIRIESCLSSNESWLPQFPISIAFDLRLTEDRDHALLTAGPIEYALERVP